MNEMKRILRVGGKALVYVWAKEQKRNNIPSTYLKVKKDEVSAAVEAASGSDIRDVASEHASHQELESQPPSNLPIHVNRTEFVKQDLLVPWNLRGKNIPKDAQGESKIYHRYYHVFEANELEVLCCRMEGIHIVNSYYDQGNWCVIFERTE